MHFFNEEIIIIFNFTSLLLRAIKLCTIHVLFNTTIYLPLSLRQQHKVTLLPISHQINCQRLGIQSNFLIAFIVLFNPLLLVLPSGSQVRCSGQSYSICVQGYTRPYPHRCMDWLDRYVIRLDAHYGSCAHPQHQLHNKVGRQPLIPWWATRQSSRLSFRRAVYLAVFHYKYQNLQQRYLQYIIITVSVRNIKLERHIQVNPACRIKNANTESLTSNHTNATNRSRYGTNFPLMRPVG